MKLPVSFAHRVMQSGKIIFLTNDFNAATNYAKRSRGLVEPNDITLDELKFSISLNHVKLNAYKTLLCEMSSNNIILGERLKLEIANLEKTIPQLVLGFEIRRQHLDELNLEKLLISGNHNFKLPNLEDILFKK